MDRPPQQLVVETGALEPSSVDTANVDVNVIELRLPCRSFRINYKVAEAGEFSLTTEFLLRLLRLVDGLPETSVSEFFGFTNDETSFVIDFVESQGFARRMNGKVNLTEAGHRLFIAGEEPALFEVNAKQERFEFDLVSFAPADSFRVLDDFEFQLPELSLPDTASGNHMAPRVFDAFKKYFQEIRMKRGGTRLEKQSLYTVDEVQAEQRFSSVVPVTLSVRVDEPEYPEASLVHWRSGTELEDRGAVVLSCANFAKEIKFGPHQLSRDAVEVLSNVAPIQLMGLHKSGILNAAGFFKAAVKQAGELRIDRPTVRVVGHLWTDANRLRFASAMRYAMTKSGGAPAMQFWLRPSVPHWGITKRVAEILAAVTRQFNEASEPTAISVRSVMAGDDRRHVPFKHVFNSVINMPPREFPSGLEMFLVPGHIAYVAVHTPIRSPEGYPVPLGVLSFDPEVVARAQASLAKIFATSFAVPYHCDWSAKDVVASVRAALQPETIVPIQTS
jgi:hypothetical protein